MTRDATTVVAGIQPAGYRLPETARIGRVRLQVSDLPASLAYYTQVQGFRLLSQERAAARLGADGGPALIDLDVVGELPATDPMWVQPARKHVLKFPSQGHCVQAGGENAAAEPATA